MTTRELHHRARFDAIRNRIFEEIGASGARWRLAWIIPFNVLVVALLVLRGEPAPRAAVLMGTLGLCALLFLARVRWSNLPLRIGALFTGATCMFMTVAVTGGLGSPLLPLSTMLVVSGSISLTETRWLRAAFFAYVFAMLVALALLSHTALGQLAPPLAPVGGWSTPEYVTIALLSMTFMMFGTYRMGCKMTRGYERVSLELAERREELCSEGEDRSRAIEGMAARLAHEVKNPLAAIKALSTHMARNATDAKSAERLAIVAAEADRLQSIVEGFLNFSRGLDDLKLAPTKPHEISRELGVLLETRAEEAGVKLEVTGDEALVLDADARKLRQALLNVVINAIQASPRGSTVRLSVARECPMTSGLGGARITVRDDGTGMTPEVLDRIRKPYFTTKEGGSGLGVAVARGLVEQHGGSMEFKSSAGKGTTVTITLPMKAKACMKLPNPLRALEPQGADTEKTAPLGAR
jgi:signal transduction histidine kinase